MAKFGYIMLADNYDCLDSDLRWMEGFGCVEVVREQPPVKEKQRTKWEALVSRLQCGDTIVIPKLSNALRGARQLVFFLEFCRVKNVRLVSIHDRIDSGDELFPDCRTSDVLTAIALLPKETNAVRRSAKHIAKVKKHIKAMTDRSINRAERSERIVNMYLHNMSVDDILAKTGLKSRTSVFRVLQEAGISPNRRKEKTKD